MQFFIFSKCNDAKFCGTVVSMSSFGQWYFPSLRRGENDISYRVIVAGSLSQAQFPRGPATRNRARDFQKRACSQAIKRVLTFDVKSNSPFVSQANTREYRKRIYQFVRCHLGLFSIHPFNFPLCLFVCFPPS